jgi:membrane protease YdiL (CAAX protease family)
MLRPRSGAPGANDVTIPSPGFPARLPSSPLPSPSRTAPIVTTDRLSRLDNRLLVASLWLVLMAIFLAGELLSPYPYGDPRFVIDYLKTELIVAGLLTVVTAWLLPARRIGLRLPEKLLDVRAMPMYVLALGAVGAWAAARLTVPVVPEGSDGQSLLVLRTTAFVGLNEEWIFRGFLLVAFVRWWGQRRGAFAALTAFSAFHLLNIAGGVPPHLALIQFVSTFLLGSVFLLGALATRSLLLPMVAHALYDFAVIDMVRLVAAGASPLTLTIVPIAGFIVGILSVFWITRLTDGEPYGPD